MSGNKSPSQSPTTPKSDISNVLTPRRKVQALLAQVSDSDSDEQPVKHLKARSKPTEQDANSNTSVEDEEAFQPGQKLVARLLGHNAHASKVVRSAAEDEDDADGADALVKTHTGSTHPVRPALDHDETSEDELAITIPGKRLFPRQEKAAVMTSTSSRAPGSRSVSPMFFSSPNSSPKSVSASPKSGHQSLEVGQKAKGRSKFLALVEKHRKERLAREAVEVAKRAAGMEEGGLQIQQKHLQRGSSPADDSEDESSDDNAAQRISKQARPTRKASKKALEEMNRETQRMSRSMQLTHQARTKTKITKESLLARFNFASSATPLPAANHKSSEIHSSATSDSEGVIQHSTPPTSPIEEPIEKDSENTVKASHDAFLMVGALEPDGDLPDLNDILNASHGPHKIHDYSVHDKSVISPRPPKFNTSKEPKQPRTAPSMTRTVPTSKSKKYPVVPLEPESDLEIEIVQDRGLKRRFAVFEMLPKRKAKETSSHIALRSLAHLVVNDEKKTSMNAAEMELSLRKKARLQAIEERNSRIEELRAKGVVIQSAEERERDQQEVEDLVERARQEASEIQKREKADAKKQGVYVRDGLDDDDDDESDDDDFEEELEAEDDGTSDSDNEGDIEDEDGLPDNRVQNQSLFDVEVDEAESNEDEEEEEHGEDRQVAKEAEENVNVSSAKVERPVALFPRSSRRYHIVSDDEDDETAGVNVNDKEILSPAALPSIKTPSAKTPQSLTRSVRKMIPGLQMSDDLPMGLSQAFAATMAESQDDSNSQIEDQDSFDLTGGLPSPRIAPVPGLQRLDSIDLVSDSQPATQTQPLNVNLSFSQSQAVPESPALGLNVSALDFTPSQRAFELTQDAGYLLSPFSGSRFNETPSKDAPHSTVDTVIMHTRVEDSPVLQRRGRLRRGRDPIEDVDADLSTDADVFKVMTHAAKRKGMQPTFDKSKSEARQHFDEAAEESEDEYAGIGGASDDDVDDEENEDDRNMIDEDTQVGKGDEAKLAGFYANRERERDEKDVSKLLKDITTGALRRKRGIGDDLDLSDEEDAAARRREAKRREFARMRRELLKDEAIGKIAEDKKKAAFLKSIEDREDDNVDEEQDFDKPESQGQETESQSQAKNILQTTVDDRPSKPLDPVSSSRTNQSSLLHRRVQPTYHQKPTNLAEIRESVSFLIEEPDSQAALVDLGLSDSEEDAEAYVNLDRHLQDAENDENMLDDDADDLGDFIVDEENTHSAEFKKPELPTKERAPFSERRTKHTNVVDRLSLMRQASSSSSSAGGSSGVGKMAFFSSKTGPGMINRIPSLLRRATTNSSLGSMSGRENVSATGVSTNNGVHRTERGDAAKEKEFIRKGSDGRRNAVNYQARTTLKEEKMSERAGIVKANTKGKMKVGNGFLNGLFRSDSWA